MDTELTIVPPKLTPFCNVLDAVVIKVFKAYMRELYSEWVKEMSTHSLLLATTENHPTGQYASGW